MTLRLIVSDVDGTLLGDDDALTTFRAWFDEQRGTVAIAYASGRSFDSVSTSIARSALPRPLAIIGNVGTEIRRYPSGESFAGWPAIAGDTWCARRIAQALDGVERLTRQPEEFQSTHKISYFLHDAVSGELEEVKGRLSQAGIAADLIYSSSRDLDVLPRGANKGTAARYLLRELNIDEEQVVVCGDSGNDRAMFEQCLRGVIVGNALSELKALGNERNYLAEKTHAAGVLEGVRYWLSSPQRTLA